MNIGIGVITMGVRELPVELYNNSSHEIYVYTDHERKGPGNARNQCLKHFDGYDHVFLFDDDTYPTRKGWEEYFIKEAQGANIHYMAIPDIFSGEFLFSESDISYWWSALGCFTYQDRVAMETIGGYNLEYNRYGYEDAARSHRALKSGLTGSSSGWGFPIRGLGYIHSEDVFGENPTPNIDAEDKMKYISQNHPIYQKEIEGCQVFYPYK